MVRILRSLVLTAVMTAFSVVPSAHADSFHTPRNGDRLHPGIANPRTLLISVTDSTRTVVLDPSAVSFDGSGDSSVYIDGDTISYVLYSTKHRFLHRSDTLSYIGYENRSSEFRPDGPVWVSVLPSADGDITADEWSGQLFRHGSMMLKHIFGRSSSSVQGGWTLTDGRDTIRNAGRLTWILDIAYADADSVLRSLPDSVASEKISEMKVDVDAVLSERLLTERSLWFCDEARYPVLTDSRVSRIMLDEAGIPTDTIPVSMLAMYYPPSFQHSDTGEDIILKKIESETPDGRSMPYADISGSDGVSENEYGPLKISTPVTSGDRITLGISSSGGAKEAVVTLFSDTGIRLSEPKNVHAGPIPQSLSFPTPSGFKGVALLRIDCGSESYTIKAIR